MKTTRGVVARLSIGSGGGSPPQRVDAAAPTSLVGLMNDTLGDLADSLAALYALAVPAHAVPT